AFINLTIESAKQPKTIAHDTIQKADINDIAHVEIDCLDMEDYIEYEIKEIIFNEFDIINAVYQAYLLVNVDITSDMISKDVAALIVIEIEGGDDYSWNFHRSEISKKFGDKVRKIIVKIDIDLDISVVDIYHEILHLHSDLCSEMPIKLREEIESTAIAFTTSLLNEISNHNINISEIYVDITYRTARGRYELYCIIADVDRTEFPIAYLVLDITRKIESNIDKRSKILKKFFEAVKAYNINSQFVFTDKDFAEINATTEKIVNLPNGDHQWLIRSDFEHYTIPPFLKIKGSETIVNTLPISPTILIKTHDFDNTPHEIPEEDARIFVMECSKLLEIEKEVQVVEQKRHRQKT
ncbi:10738_t:CDS:2, partial [Scutellospora calospora]